MESAMRQPGSAWSSDPRKKQRPILFYIIFLLQHFGWVSRRSNAQTLHFFRRPNGQNAANASSRRKLSVGCLRSGSAPGAALRVELVGFEPTSAQGNHALSTCLSQPLVFVRRQDLGHQPAPYPLKIHPRHGAAVGYSRFNLHRLISGFGTTSSERCLVALSHSAIRPVTYYTSVRQRERNCFRQLIFRSL